MKYHLIILSALLLNVLAHPVPDEEVSPLKPVTPVEANSELKQAPVEQTLEEAKPEILAAEESKPEKALPQKLALPEAAPDAEIAQALPEKLEEKASLEKQARVDNKVSDEVKTIPVVETSVVGVENEKQVVDEVKSGAQPVGKNANIAFETPAAEAPVSEQKQDLLSAIETAPSVKSEIPIATPTENAEAPAAIVPAITEEKKEEQAVRQERGTEEIVKPVVSEETVKPVVEAKVDTEVKPEVKSLEPSKTEEAAEPVVEGAELKTVASEKLVELASAAPAAGDIPAQEKSQELNAKALPVEGEKVAESAAPVVLPEPKNIEEKIIEKSEETKPATPIIDLAAKAPESAEPLKKLEETAAIIEDKKSEESKESKESKESSSDSKESEESKEDKSN